MLFLFFKQKTAYEMRISDWSSDVCSSDLHGFGLELGQDHGLGAEIPGPQQHRIAADMAEGYHAQARIGARQAIPHQMPPRLIARKQVAVGARDALGDTGGARPIYQRGHVVAAAGLATPTIATPREPILRNRRHHPNHTPTHD